MRTFLKMVRLNNRVANLIENTVDPRVLLILTPSPSSINFWDFYHYFWALVAALPPPSPSPPLPSPPPTFSPPFLYGFWTSFALQPRLPWNLLYVAQTGHKLVILLSTMITSINHHIWLFEPFLPIHSLSHWANSYWTPTVCWPVSRHWGYSGQ